MNSNQRDSSKRLLNINTAAMLVAVCGMTAPLLAPPDEVCLTGFVRDFSIHHPDMEVDPPDGEGHYAGNVSQTLGPDGAPLQVHGVTDFVIDFGSLVPGDPYAARLTALGAEITSGGTPMPVTIETETDSEVFEPYGLYNDPGGDGNINDGQNPRHFIYSLTDIYSAGTPISVTATSWMPQFSVEDAGWDIEPSSVTQTGQADQLATLVTLPEDGTLTSISAYTFRNSGDNDIKFAIYDDNGGEPGDLIIETNEGNSPSGLDWLELTVNNTWLAAGDYWLAISFENDGDQAVAYENSSGYKTRRNNTDAVNTGFVATWPQPHESEWDSRRLAMYMTYTADTPTYAPYMTAKSGDNSQQVIVLRDGSDVPAIPGFQDQNNLAVFVEPYVNVATGKIVLQDNQAIYLFELGTSNLSSAAADFQDLVMLVTLATDPTYFYSPGTDSWDLDPIGFKVASQWRDSDGNNIAPHLYAPGWGDQAGASGVTSSGGVTSPATFYEWYRDTLGVNLGQTLDLCLDKYGSGSSAYYEFASDKWLPIDGQLLGNEGDSENDNFTYALAANFTYKQGKGQFIEVRGGDGLWVFIGKRLVLDLGGAKNEEVQYLDLDRLGLSNNNDYQLRLFYANRGRYRAFRATTNVFLEPGPILGGITATFD